jgi:hypothetical protein
VVDGKVTNIRWGLRSFRGARSANPESIGNTVCWLMDSGLVLRTPRNDSKGLMPALLAEPKFSSNFNVIWSVQPSREKYSSFVPTQISSFYAPSHPARGALAIVTNARWDAVDAMAMTDEAGLSRTAKSCGSDAAVLASSFTGQPVERRWQESRSPGRARSKP